MNEATLIGAIGSLVGAIGLLFNYFIKSVEKSEKRNQEEVSRLIKKSDEEVSRIMNICEERLQSEKVARESVMQQMERMGDTLENISSAIQSGLSNVDQKITRVSEKVDIIESDLKNIKDGCGRNQ